MCDLVGVDFYFLRVILDPYTWYWMLYRLFHAVIRVHYQRDGIASQLWKYVLTATPKEQRICWMIIIYVLLFSIRYQCARRLAGEITPNFVYRRLIIVLLVDFAQCYSFLVLQKTFLVQQCITIMHACTNCTYRPIYNRWRSMHCLLFGCYCDREHRVIFKRRKRYVNYVTCTYRL